MRCFIAIDLNIKVELKRIQEHLQNDNRNMIKANFVNPEILHLTLRFLGELDDFKVNKTKDIVREALKNARIQKFNARLNSLGVFPSEHFIRVVWASLEPNEKFLEIHNIIDNELEKLKIKKDERFESHVTLARVKWLKDKKDFIEKLKKIKVEPVEFVVDSIKLKKSTLTKQGPIYEDIYEFKLI